MCRIYPVLRSTLCDFLKQRQGAAQITLILQGSREVRDGGQRVRMLGTQDPRSHLDDLLEALTRAGKITLSVLRVPQSVSRSDSGSKNSIHMFIGKAIAGIFCCVFCDISIANYVVGAIGLARVVTILSLRAAR